MGRPGELRLWIEFEHLPEGGGELLVHLSEDHRVRITILAQHEEHGFETVALLEKEQALLLSAALKAMAR